MAKVALDNVVKHYGPVVAVDHVSLTVEDGEFLAFLGPSGCGKTSTMRMIAGLENITSGTIYIGDQVVNDLAPAERNVAMAFESYGLYPHMTVFNNIAYPLKIRGTAEAEIKQKIVSFAQLLDITEELDSRPSEVNRGVQQRVSLARALVRDPSVFLLDEPLSHLDADLRSQMRGELKHLHLINESTTIYVTHDQLEAMTMADRIVVMNAGKFLQVGSPAEVFFTPANRFVASFIGEPPMNIMRGEVHPTDNGSVAVSIAGHKFATIEGLRAEKILQAADNDENMIEVGIRPRGFKLNGPDTEGLPAEVRIREFSSENVLLTLDAADDNRLRLEMPIEVTANRGDTVTLRPSRSDQLHFFSVSSGDAVAPPELAQERSEESEISGQFADRAGE